MGFNVKGNDYLAKPFYPEELLARIRERFEHTVSVETADETYSFGNTFFNYATNEICNGNSKTLLTSRQADILRILVRNFNKAVDRTVLLKAIWKNDSYANSLALNVQITYLRKALKKDQSVGIVSLTRKGYVLKDIH